MKFPTQIFDRRALLKSLSLLPISALGTVPFWATQAAAQAGLAAGNVCMVSPETTEGPYYIDPKLIRADITEGKSGVPLAMTVQVLSAECVPLSGARVDIWHCDADGNYSGFARQGSDAALDTEGQTFLRGTLFSDANGVVTFQTIFPGWYRGRATHIHYMIYLDENTVLTSQIFFPQAAIDELYRAVSPYKERAGSPEITNDDDRIARNAGDGAIASLAADGAGYASALVVGVQV